MSRCVTCGKMRANPPNPLMSDLPLGRLAYGQFPFCHCGIDYFGPVMVKVADKKNWGLSSHVLQPELSILKLPIR